MHYEYCPKMGYKDFQLQYEPHRVIKNISDLVLQVEAVQYQMLQFDTQQGLETERKQLLYISRKFVFSDLMATEYVEMRVIHRTQHVGSGRQFIREATFCSISSYALMSYPVHEFNRGYSRSARLASRFRNSSSARCDFSRSFSTTAAGAF